MCAGEQQPVSGGCVLEHQVGAVDKTQSQQAGRGVVPVSVFAHLPCFCEACRGASALVIHGAIAN